MIQKGIGKGHNKKEVRYMKGERTKKGHNEKEER